MKRAVTSEEEEDQRSIVGSVSKGAGLPGSIGEPVKGSSTAVGSASIAALASSH